MEQAIEAGVFRAADPLATADVSWAQFHGIVTLAKCQLDDNSLLIKMQNWPLSDQSQPIRATLLMLCTIRFRSVEVAIQVVDKPIDMLYDTPKDIQCEV